MVSRRAVGIDGTKKDLWVAVLIDASGYLDSKVGSLSDLVDWSEPVHAIGIDIPILDADVDPGARAADLAARAFVGPRRSSVFAAPPLKALAHGTLPTDGSKIVDYQG